MPWNWRLLVNRLYQNGRQVIRRFGQTAGKNKETTLSKGRHIQIQAPIIRTPRQHSGGLFHHLQVQTRKLFVEGLLRRVTSSFAVELRRRAAQRLFTGDSAPFFALVGVSLASGTGIITKEDEMEGVCLEIREAVSKLKSVWEPAEAMDDEFTSDSTLSLNNFKVGPLIAKGCNAAVYAAQWKELEDSETEFVIDNDMCKYPLAVKMMFNYEAESNAPAILRTMYRETVPAVWCCLDQDDHSQMDQRLYGHKKSIPSHPNIVQMPYVFTDRVPALPEAMTSFPAALPYRLNPAGAGRNMSLFLVMKRYTCNLQEYLSTYSPNMRVRVMMLCQLLEGVGHLIRSEVAHRDLKTDNILVDLSNGADSPQMVITDFGCSLSDASLGLSLPFVTFDTDKGGNSALMAPEVACATPGPFSTIDFTKSDAWTVGAIAYEIFGAENPFYRDNGSSERLDSRTYEESCLPRLPPTVPIIIQSVVYDLLQRNPYQRLSADTAATLCQLYLWAPSKWMNQAGFLPSQTEVMQWLLCLTTKVLCETHFPASSKQNPTLEYQLVSTFLKRLRLYDVMAALKWITTN